MQHACQSPLPEMSGISAVHPEGSNLLGLEGIASNLTVIDEDGDFGGGDDNEHTNAILDADDADVRLYNSPEAMQLANITEYTAGHDEDIEPMLHMLLRKEYLVASNLFASMITRGGVRIPPRFWSDVVAFFAQCKRSGGYTVPIIIPPVHEAASDAVRRAWAKAWELGLYIYTNEKDGVIKLRRTPRKFSCDGPAVVFLASAYDFQNENRISKWRKDMSTRTSSRGAVESTAEPVHSPAHDAHAGNSTSSQGNNNDDPEMSFASEESSPPDQALSRLMTPQGEGAGLSTMGLSTMTTASGDSIAEAIISHGREGATECVELYSMLDHVQRIGECLECILRGETENQEEFEVCARIIEEKLGNLQMY